MSVDANLIAGFVFVVGGGALFLALSGRIVRDYLRRFPPLVFPYRMVYWVLRGFAILMGLIFIALGVLTLLDYL